MLDTKGESRGIAIGWRLCLQYCIIIITCSAVKDTFDLAADTCQSQHISRSLTRRPDHKQKIKMIQQQQYTASDKKLTP